MARTVVMPSAGHQRRAGPNACDYVVTLPSGTPMSRSGSRVALAATDDQGFRGQEMMDDLPDDLLLEVINSLSPHHRQVVASACKRLNALCYGTYTALAVPLPIDTITSTTNRRPGAAVAALCSGMAHLPSKRFDSIRTLVLQLASPAPCEADEDCSDSKQPLEGREEHPGAPLNAWLRAFFGGGTRRCIESIRICAKSAGAGTPLPELPLGACALRMLALGCPNLRRLVLPLVPRGASSSLPLLKQLDSLTLTVADGVAVDCVLQLTQLRSLSISTQKDLFYLVLQQQQVEQLSRFPHLTSLQLQNVVLHDCRATFATLEAGGLTAHLTELRTSFPFAPERLEHLPALQLLQLPFFSSSLEGLGKWASKLTELRVRQSLQDHDLLYLSSLHELHTLQCDSIVLSATSLAVPGYVGGGLVLPSVCALRMTGGYHHTGMLGALFPGLETLQVGNVLLPNPMPATLAPFPRLQRLSWPASKAVQSLVAACPALVSLTVTSIGSQQRLEEVLTVPKLPVGLRAVTLAFAGCLQRFRPKQVQILLARMPASMDQLDSMALRDEANKDSSQPGRLLDDFAVQALLARMRCLRELRLSGCGGVTSNGLAAAVSEASPRLEHLVVAGCPGCTRRRSVERIPGDQGKHWLQVDWQESMEL